MAWGLIRQLLAIGLLAPMILQAAERNLYRYTTDDDVVVVDYQVPHEYIGHGYEVLDSKGKVIKVVPPHLGPDGQRARDEARLEAQRLQEWDESLLIRYSTVADVEAARDRSLGELRARLEILKSNQRGYRRQVEVYQVQAANQERRAGKVDVKLVIAIEDLQDEIVGTERAIAERELEIEQVSGSYQRDIERFRELEDLVEWRRALSTPRE